MPGLAALDGARAFSPRMRRLPSTIFVKKHARAFDPRMAEAFQFPCIAGCGNFCLTCLLRWDARAFSPGTGGRR